MDPVIYLTAEVKHRDLEPRIEIASHLLAAGYAVVVGQQWGIFENYAHLPPGAVLFKTVNSIQATNMRLFHDAGHLVAATDEEVLNFRDASGYMLAFGEKAARNCDLFLAQNKDHARAVVEKFRFLDGKIKVVGSPRVDALSPQHRSVFDKETDEIRRQYGPFILFNTSFGSTNSMWGGFEDVKTVAVRTGDLNVDDAASVAQFEAIYRWEERNKTELTRVLNWAVEHLPSHKIVLRPHPGENPEYWRQTCGDRVTIVSGTNPHPWIQACDLVIHAGCTTGLEAALLDKPALNLMASVHPVSDRVVNWVNPKVETADEAISAIRLFFEGRGPLTENSDVYRAEMMRQFPTYGENASARKIADELVRLLKRHNAPPQSGYRPVIQKYKRLKRPDILKAKFSATAQEIGAGLNTYHVRDKLRFSAKVYEMDESLFFLAPN